MTETDRLFTEILLQLVEHAIDTNDSSRAILPGTFLKLRDKLRLAIKNDSYGE